ncbi:MAG: hypothetical protein PHI12_10425 [Dehalococcoidales bacterium]|nr:hypothetical protein [Dehalococcoidales bacterium]
MIRLIFGRPEPHQIKGGLYRCGDVIHVPKNEVAAWEACGFYRPQVTKPQEKEAVAVVKPPSVKPRRRSGRR